jgi:hypothetical protein
MEADIPIFFRISLTQDQLNFIVNEYINNHISLKHIQQSVAEIKPEEILKESPEVEKLNELTRNHSVDYSNMPGPYIRNNIIKGSTSALKGKKITSVSETPKQMFRRIQSKSNIKKRDSHGRFLSSKKKIKNLKK